MEAATITEVPQHLKALRTANRVRLGAAALKRALAAGEITLGEALDDPRAVSLELLALLMAQRRWGIQRARRTVRGASLREPVLHIPENKRVGDMTTRQKARIEEAALPGVRW